MEEKKLSRKECAGLVEKYIQSEIGWDGPERFEIADSWISIMETWLPENPSRQCMEESLQALGQLFQVIRDEVVRNDQSE